MHSLGTVILKSLDSGQVVSVEAVADRTSWCLETAGGNEIR